MTASNAARIFSDVLNRVARGEKIEVTRTGAAVAVISSPRSDRVSPEQFRQLIAAAPSPDAGFLDDVRIARSSVMPPEHEWQS